MPRDDALAGSGPRPLGVAHFQWWRRVYGATYEAGALPQVHRDPHKGDVIKKLFSAIRDNHLAQVHQILDVYPQLGFTKGSNERTALYIASFFARYEVVKLLLTRGADIQLCSDGILPLSVVGYGRNDAVDKMKVKCLLEGSKELHVLLVQPLSTDDDGSFRRVHIHFSEPVENLIEEDLQMKNCTIEKMTRMSGELFTITVRVSARRASIQVPMGVVASRRKMTIILSNCISNLLFLT